TQDLTSNVTWASSQPDIATVGATGLATGVSPGSTTVTAVFAGFVGTSTLTVTNATVNLVTVTPNPAMAPAGTQIQFTAIGTFVDTSGNTSTVNLTPQVTWTSSDVTVATINNVGTVNTAKAGTVTITATFTQNVNGVPVTVSGTADLTVQ